MKKTSILTIVSIVIFAMSVELYGIGLGPVNVGGGGISVNVPHVNINVNPGRGVTVNHPAGSWNSKTGMNVNFYGVHYDRNSGLRFSVGAIPYVGGYINAYTNLANIRFGYSQAKFSDYSHTIAEHNNHRPEYLSESQRMNTEEMGALFEAQEYFSPKWFEILNFTAVREDAIQIARNHELNQVKSEYNVIRRKEAGNPDMRDFERSWQVKIEAQQTMEMFRVQQEQILDLVRKGQISESKYTCKNLQRQIQNSRLKTVSVEMLILSISLEYAHSSFLVEAEEWADFAMAYMNEVGMGRNENQRLTSEQQCQFWDYYATRFFVYGAYAVSEKLYKKSLAIKTSNRYSTKTSEAFLARLYQVEGRYDEAQMLWKHLSATDEGVLPGEALANYGTAQFFLGNNIEAEKYLQEAIQLLTAAKANMTRKITDKRIAQIHELEEELKALGSKSENRKRIENTKAAIRNLSQIPDMSIRSCLTGCFVRLAGIYLMQRRFDDAEKMLFNAASEKEQVLQWEDPHIDFQRIDRACISGKYILAKASEEQKAIGLVPIYGIRALMNLKKSQDPSESDEECLKIALGFCTINIDTLSKQDDVASAQSLAEAYLTRSEVYYRLNRYRDALVDLNAASEIILKKNCHKTFLASLYCSAGDVYLEMGAMEYAEKMFNAAWGFFRLYRVSPAKLCRLYYGLARVYYQQGKTNLAIKALNVAMEQSLLVRKTASIDVGQKAEIFSEYYHLYETMIQWQYTLGEEGSTDEIYYAMERSRAQGLKDLMAAANIDLLEGVEPQLKARLKNEYNLAWEALNNEKKKLGNLLKAYEEKEDPEIVEQRKTVDACEARVVEAYRAMQLASPALNSKVNARLLPSLSEATALLNENKVTAFEYLLAENGTYLFVYGFDVAPKLYKLVVTEKQADLLNQIDSSLQLSEGPLTEQSLSKILHSNDGTGIIDCLKDQRKDDRKAAKALKVLYSILLPEDLGEFLENRQTGEYALILPDGALSQLPFEVLVTQGGSKGFENARFLLDQDVTLFYSPSLSFYYNLQHREKSRLDGVLTIGIKDYSHNSCLKDLPGAEKESDMIRLIAQKKGLKVNQLKQDATERKVREALPHSFEIHCGCHAIVENRYGNILSRLVLVPGENFRDTSNDGALTLQEICNIRLDDCSLVFLSACETNNGQNQLGEGTWSLSRGMLVAGTQTVISSNWTANDTATSELVSQFFQRITESHGMHGMTYVDALKNAKIALRSNDQVWAHPYYWAPFVALGNK